ncbi:MAG: hypothetical protein JRI55_23680 [Deltaproteobacteria bacterium]|nr:hypothetical protein [Deltaproteobacteria bacterium]
MGGWASHETCVYPGIPHPTDLLPSGIMPTLPTPDSVAGFPYDPCTLQAPEPSDGPDSWIVSVSGDDATAGNDGQGTLAAPRRTVPVGAFGPGTAIFLLGASSSYGTVDFDMGDDNRWQFTCTDTEPCWVVGVDGPRVGRQIEIHDSSHLLIEGLSVVDVPGGGRPWGNLRFQDSQYVTLRDTEVRGDGTNSSGGSAVSMSNVQYMVTLRASIHEIGSWNSNATGLDVHGWRPAYENRYLWLLDSELYHLQADGVQTGNSNNPNPQPDTSHYIYIGGNLFYENYENAVDNKNSYHVIISSNDVHDHYAAPDGGGANNTSIILSNNSEGPWTGYHWAINNRVWNTGLAIRDSGSEADEKNFMVGNLVWNADTAFIQANNAPGRELWLVNNTASGSTTAFDVYQPGSGSSTYVRRNVFHQAGELDTMTDVDSELEDNVLFGTTAQGQWDVDEGNVTGDPLLTSPGDGDMTPGVGSVAIDSTSEDAVYALFTTLYGLDIRTDRAGTTRPQGAWDMGAVEAP